MPKKCGQYKIEQLEHRQNQLLTQLAPIQAELNDTTAEIERLKYIFAPIRGFPLEILGEIFLSMPTSQLRPGNYQKHVARVSLVCKNWRDAARFTPRLWCDIWVKADAPGLTYESLLAWTSRGGSIPKNLEISSSRCGRLDRCVGRNLCARRRCLFSNVSLAKFLKHAPAEWRAVTLNCPTPNCLRTFVASLNRLANPVASGGWNTVRSFEVNLANWTSWISSQKHKILGFIPTSVTSVSLHLPRIPDSGDLDGGDVDIELEESQWEWSLHVLPNLLQGLTTLELKFDTEAVFAEPLLFTLHRCSKLETLKIDFHDGLLVGEENFPVTRIIFAELRRLHLLQVPGECIQDLCKLKFPKLLDMSMSVGIDSHVDLYDERPRFSPRAHNTDTMWFDGDGLAEFIGGDGSSPSTLRTLHLKGATFLPGVLHRVMRDLHSLSHLKLEWMALLSEEGSCEDDFMNLIEDDPPSLRSLKTLEISRLTQPVDGEVPFLEQFVNERDIDLKLSTHGRGAWKSDDNRYSYLVGLGSDSEDEA